MNNCANKLDQIKTVFEGHKTMLIAIQDNPEFRQLMGQEAVR